MTTYDDPQVEAAFRAGYRYGVEAMQLEAKRKPWLIEEFALAEWWPCRLVSVLTGRAA